MPTSYIGADVDCKMTELAVEENQKIVYRSRVKTTIPALREELAKFGGKKILILEECSLASWLYRNLQGYATEIAVCDPRRNSLIYKDGDKADDLDAADLAALHRGGFTRLVHHPIDENRQALRDVVALYHDRVRQKVREINKFYAACYGHGWMVAKKDFLHPDRRQKCFDLLPNNLREQLEILAVGVDSVVYQAQQARKLLIRRARKFETIKNWNELPGVSWIRSSTLFAYLDTPWRFKTTKRLWKYCGVGLCRFASGSDKNGIPRTGKLKMHRYVNRKLKAAILGAAMDAIKLDGNEFSEHYERMVRYGVTPKNARHTVGRKMLTLMSGMWKTDTQYVPGLRN